MGSIILQYIRIFLVNFSFKGSRMLSTNFLRISQSGQRSLWGHNGMSNPPGCYNGKSILLGEGHSRKSDPVVGCGKPPIESPFPAVKMRISGGGQLKSDSAAIDFPL